MVKHQMVADALNDINDDMAQAETKNTNQRYEPVNQLGFDVIFVTGLDGIRIEAHPDQTITWRDAVIYRAVIAGWRRWFEIVASEPWMIVRDISTEIREEFRTHLPTEHVLELRLRSAADEAMRLAILRGLDTLECNRTEASRMRPPADRLPQDRIEFRLDGTKVDIPVDPAKTPILVVEERDDEGWMQRHERSIDTLGTLHRAGTITSEWLAAGEGFHREFMLAHLNPLKASSYGRIGGCSPKEMPARVLHAKQRIAEALRALGGKNTPIAIAVWNVAGEGKTIVEYAILQAWGKRGRSLNPKIATGLLVGGLSILAENWFDSNASRDRSAPNADSQERMQASAVPWIALQIRDCQEKGEISSGVADKLINTMRRTAAEGRR